ncbi:hypothetical protein [Solilutibacter silvestris]|uniref:hypothetical protein n=1 Tax=Solilutibacter silvestris TaxID=1645665 RepID=UPI00197B0C7B|nr:hypothetical protein [Lysobacter silvestris]
MAVAGVLQAELDEFVGDAADHRLIEFGATMSSRCIAVSSGKDGAPPNGLITAMI